MNLKNLVAKIAHVGNLKIITREYLNSLGYNNLKVAEFKDLVKFEITRQKDLQSKRSLARYLPMATTIKQRLRALQDRKQRIKKDAEDLSRQQQELDKLLKTTVVEAQRLQSLTVVNGTIFRVLYDEEKIWNYYAKSYKFPKVTISRRRIEIVNPKLHSQYISFERINTIAYLENFAGNYLINAIAEYFKMQPIKVCKALKPVQLNVFFNPVLVHEFKSYKIYKLMFADQLVKFCIVDNNGNTFHGDKSELVKGLQTKLQAKVERFATVIDYKYCKTLGFCDEGIEFFKADNNITVDSMTFEELQAVVTQNKETNEKYTAELRRMGIKI